MFTAGLSPERVIAAHQGARHGVRMASLRLVITSLITAALLAVAPAAHAIVGGTPSSGADTPAVFVGQINAPRQACTGVALSPTLVLTAAHCGLLADGTAPAGQPFAVFK